MKSETIRWKCRARSQGERAKLDSVNKHQGSIGKGTRLVFLPQYSSVPLTTTSSGDNLPFLWSGYFTFILLLLEYDTYVTFTI